MVSYLPTQCSAPAWILSVETSVWVQILSQADPHPIAKGFPASLMYGNSGKKSVLELSFAHSPASAPLRGSKNWEQFCLPLIPEYQTPRLTEEEVPSAQKDYFNPFLF